MPFPALPVNDLDHVFAHTADVWSEARGRRIFLTGGTGFFGPWLVEAFAHANERLGLGAELVVLTRDPKGALTRLPHYSRQRGVSLYHGDVREFTRPPGRFDYVIHAATES